MEDNVGERASRRGRSLPNFGRPPDRVEEATDVLDWMASSESEWWFCLAIGLVSRPGMGQVR